MEVDNGVNTMFSKFVYKFDHLFKISFIVPIFFWLYASPPSLLSNYIAPSRTPFMPSSL